MSEQMKAVLFLSEERFITFQKKLAAHHIETVLLDFAQPEWLSFDYKDIDFIIYYPSFKYSSNHPHALQEVHDNFLFLSESYPEIHFYPDPSLIRYYNDKYRQYLFLKKHGYPIPETMPLYSPASLDAAEKHLGYPMVLKNRYGAGGNSVFRVFCRSELEMYYRISTLNLFNFTSLKYFARLLGRRLFYYHLIKAKRMPFPFLSPPLLAQKFIKIDRDLKTVTGDNAVVEAHWRYQANPNMWKMNIDGGGTGVWSRVPQSAIDLSVRLAKDLRTRWLNIDFILSDNDFLITEFSPVWHHYAYQEKDSFVYSEDYNIEMPLTESLDLEEIILRSLISASKSGIRRASK